MGGKVPKLLFLQFSKRPAKPYIPVRFRAQPPFNPCRVDRRFIRGPELEANPHGCGPTLGFRYVYVLQECSARPEILLASRCRYRHCAFVVGRPHGCGHKFLGNPPTRNTREIRWGFALPQLSPATNGGLTKNPRRTETTLLMPR